MLNQMISSKAQTSWSWRDGSAPKNTCCWYSSSRGSHALFWSPWVLTPHDGILTHKKNIHTHKNKQTISVTRKENKTKSNYFKTWGSPYNQTGQIKGSFRYNTHTHKDLSSLFSYIFVSVIVLVVSLVFSGWVISVALLLLLLTMPCVAMCRCRQRSEMLYLPGFGVTSGCWIAWYGCWQLNSGLLERQYVLWTAEPPL